MNTKTRLWVLAVGVICAAVVLLGVVGGLMPQLTEAGSSYRMLQDVRDRNETVRAQIQELEAAEADLSELELQYEALTSAIPAEVDTAGLLRELQTLQDQSGARVLDLALQPAESLASASEAASSTGETVAEGEAEASTATELPGLSAHIDRVPLTLQLQGTPQQITDFVKALQLGERLVLVDQVEITPAGDLSNGTVIGAIFTIGGL